MKSLEKVIKNKIRLIDVKKPGRNDWLVGCIGV